PVALILVAACLLAAVGGAYDWSVYPSLLIVAALFLISGARVAADPLMRRLDIALIVSLGLVALQLVPLPASLVATSSPSTVPLQEPYALDATTAWRTVSVHPAATRIAFAIALTGALMFWAAREVLSRSGLRTVVRVLGWVGALCSLVALAQHVTAPRTIYWIWHLADPRAVPFGPFIDRNHLATWLVLAICLVTGRLAMRVSSEMRERGRGGISGAVVVLLDEDAAGIAARVALTCRTLAHTRSRSGGLARTVR